MKMINSIKHFFKNFLSKILGINYVNLKVFRAEAKDVIQDQRYWQFGSLSSPPYLEIKPDPEYYPYTIVTVKTPIDSFSERLYYAHLALAKLVTEYDFNTILELGSANSPAAKVFKAFGKEVTTLEFLPNYESTYSGDYLDIKFPQQFDAIWCSHVLEHQRNVGIFLEKLFFDLKEGGILAISVPSNLSSLLIGHCNIYTPLVLVYNLILAGFDCREAKIKYYDAQFSILVRKKSNQLKSISFASTHYPHPDKSNTVGYVPDLLQFFPINIPPNGTIWGEIESLNWD